MQETYICYAQRTPVGKLSGALSSVPAPRLGAALVKDAVSQLKLDPKAVDQIIMGQVLPAGAGQAPARQAAIYGGLPESVCALTINRVCGSGLKAVMLADQAIKLEDSEVIFAGGQESMSLAPHLLMGSRNGYKFGSVEMKDHMQWDGLWDPYDNVAMGNCGEICAKKYDFTREAQDEFARRSFERARQATESGHFAREIVAVEIPSKKGSVRIDKDEQPFSVDLAKLSELRPAFDKAGTITAGNASSLNDGAGLIVVASEKAMKRHGLRPLARIVAQASFAQAPSWFTTAPIPCLKKVAERADWKLSDVDQFEINEAFAVVTMAAMKDLNLAAEKVNPYGGAIAIGHPIGASGARILATLINGLKSQNKKRGIATLCIGGGEASALAVEMV